MSPRPPAAADAVRTHPLARPCAQQPACTPTRRSQRPRLARRPRTCRSSSRATCASTASPTRNRTCAGWTVRAAFLRSPLCLWRTHALTPPPRPSCTELRKLGGPSFTFSPSDILVVEDAPSGLKSGLAAGCQTLGVSTGQPMERFRTFDATVKTVDLTRCARFVASRGHGAELTVLDPLLCAGSRSCTRVPSLSRCASRRSKKRRRR